MSNSSYLCCSDFKGMYPCSRAAGYDPEKQTVAVSIDAIPLLWLALFRVGDVKTERFQDPRSPADEMSATAPVCTTKRALSQLDGALPVLNHLFAEYGRLDGHAAALRSAGGKYVTVECEEIVMLHDDEESYFKSLRRVLRLLSTKPEGLGRGS